MTIRVVVADDQVLVRSGFAMLLDGEPDIDVVGAAGDGAEAVSIAANTRPDVILMDVRMPVMDGLEATRRITDNEALVATRVIILTTFDLDEVVHEALRAGASGFLLKDTLPTELLHAVSGGRRRCAHRTEDHPPTDRGVRPPPGPGHIRTRVAHAVASHRT
jgi:DNA-binding NarL/FixJ family response regulator